MFFKNISKILTSPEKKKIIFLFFLTIVATILELIGIGLVIPILNFIITPEKIEKIHYFSNFTYNESLIILLSLLIIGYLIKNLFIAFFSIKKIRYLNTIALNLSKRLLSLCIKQSYYFFLNKNTAELIRDIKFETVMFSSILLHFINLLTESLIVLGILIVLIYLEPNISIVIALVIILFSLFIYRFSKKRMQNWGKKRQYFSAESQKSITQSLNSIKETKILGKEDNFIKIFEKDFSQEFFYNGNARILNAMPRLIIEILIVVIFSFIVLFLTFQNRTQTELIIILGLAGVASFRIMPSIGRILVSAQQLRFSLPSYNKILELSKLSPNTEKNKLDVKFENKLVFENVSFKYFNSNENVFENTNFEIKEGDCIGIIGKSGSGKTTLINLLLGLFHPSSGRIVVNGKFLLGEDYKWSKENIGYVPQNIYMIDDTIKKNIAFGIETKEIDDQLIKRCLEKAQLKNFLNSSPNGVDTIVGEQGSRISGGEKQRLAIARALYFKSDLFIFDEPTSSIDQNTEIELIKVIKELKKNKTIIIVSHKMSVLEDCNKIFKIEKKKIVKI